MLEEKQVHKRGRKRDETILGLNRKIDLLELRSSCINNVEISNFPITQGENLVKIFMSIGVKVREEVNDNGIQAIHRVRRYNASAVRNIVSQFVSQWKKNLFIQACSKFRKTNGNKISPKYVCKELSDQKIYIVEHLSPKYEKFLGKTKLRAKETGWKFDGISMVCQMANHIMYYVLYYVGLLYLFIPPACCDVYCNIFIFHFLAKFINRYIIWYIFFYLHIIFKFYSFYICLFIYTIFLMIYQQIPILF